MKKIPMPLWLKENLKKKRFNKSSSPISPKKYGIIKNKKIKLIDIK